MANKVKISEQNFMAYLERLTAAVGHADRHEPLRVYLEGQKEKAQTLTGDWIVYRRRDGQNYYQFTASPTSRFSSAS
jgi:hypothetical protein